MDPREAGQQRLFSAALGPPAVPGSLLASEAQRDQVLGARRGLQEPRVTDAPGPSRPHPHGTSGARAPAAPRGLREARVNGCQGRGARKAMEMTRCFVIVCCRSLRDTDRNGNLGAECVAAVEGGACRDRGPKRRSPLRCDVARRSLAGRAATSLGAAERLGARPGPPSLCRGHTCVHTQGARVRADGPAVSWELVSPLPDFHPGNGFESRARGSPSTSLSVGPPGTQCCVGRQERRAQEAWHVPAPGRVPAVPGEHGVSVYLGSMGSQCTWAVPRR